MIIMDASLAWLYWNPERIVFTVPIIHRPVVWYGLWFVFGYIVGYLILIPIFQKRLQSSTQILNRDIANWPKFIELLRTNNSPATAKTQKLLNSVSHTEVTPILKEKILASLNQSGLTRSEIETLFPKVIYTTRSLACLLVDRLTWFIIAGTIIGARLGHVFFYDWPRYQNHWGDIFKVWEGGLASHGGAIGVIIGVIFYWRMIRKNFPEISILNLTDMIIVPTGFAICCIRIGNFFNQEILGKESTVPWAIIFGDPIDGGPIVPRHPVQLYEAAVYLFTFGLLFYLWKTREATLKPGLLTGIFFVLVFSARFIIEFWKMPQSMIMDETILQTGQLLSIPFILAGVILCIYSLKYSK